MILPIKLNITEFNKLIDDNKEDAKKFKHLKDIKDSTGINHIDDNIYIRYLKVGEILFINKLISDDYPNIKDTLKENMSGLIYNLTVDDLELIYEWYSITCRNSMTGQEDEDLITKLFGEQNIYL